MNQENQSQVNRRSFVKTAVAGAGLTLVKPESVFGAPANSALTLGLIGCGGRGTHDSGQFVRITNTQVVALADPFKDRLERAKEALDKRLSERNRPLIDASRLYQGMDAYKDLLASDVDMVIITSPPYYHPLHLEAAVAAGKHIYMEKPVATDVVGAKRVMEIGQKAQGKVSLAVGFQIRFSEGYGEIVKRVQEGAIGEVVSGQVYYHAGRLDNRAREGASEGENRIRNWVFDIELSGDIIVEQNIHVIDVANWYLQSHPVKAFLTGGRKARTDVGDCWDHFMGIYWYPNGTKVDFSSSQFLKGWSDCRNRFFGTKGVADTAYSGHPQITGDNPYEHPSDDPLGNTESNKITNFFESIQSGNFINEAQQGAESTLSSILGRISAYEGREVTWDEMMASDQKYDVKIEL
ncbi:MAG TPA: Gfo/Idh/MocA family oxidoreductase [bacterium]|nr:Gfo/Idh/MocA family oxidoreductase [bacterium]HPP01228.1 Gfo/Idh/MocA family oxidoreductase [bacterium]